MNKLKQLSVNIISEISKLTEHNNTACIQIVEEELLRINNEREDKQYIIDEEWEEL